MITGLNYLKDGTDPVTMKDEDYPAWLWECLDVVKKASDEDGLDDEFCTFPCQTVVGKREILTPE